ncbi:hypothetical protein CRUP_029022 [Coryphaenoides rupestris]|nr:hypothetical protein CRUP_029022 [Coryphaenoides rupestris]
MNLSLQGGGAPRHRVGGICGSAPKRASRSAPAHLPPPVVRRTPPAAPDLDETLAGLRRFPGPGLKRTHPHGSESRNNKLLRLVTVSEKRWRARSRATEGGGGADDGGRAGGLDADDDGFPSGDCDDEDEECAGVSGLGPPPRRKRLRIFSDLADNLPMDDLNFHEQLLTPHLATAGIGGFSSPRLRRPARASSSSSPSHPCSRCSHRH